MGQILVGTSSWTDKTLIESGRFYPREARSAEARLRYYAAQFPLVEIDSTYYALPAERTAQLWVDRTPQGFVFNVKAFRLFTGHQAQAAALPADLRKALPPKEKSNLYYRELSDEIRRELWNRFRSGLEPLRRSGKLGVVLLQFAPWFVFGRESFAHILHCAQMLAGLPLAVEFRNKSWFGEKTRDKALAFEREHSLAHVAVDEGAMWAKKGLASAAERFDYLYSTAELKALGQPVKDLASKARRVHVLFNNCHGDKAQRNAAQFRQLIA